MFRDFALAIAVLAGFSAWNASGSVFEGFVAGAAVIAFASILERHSPKGRKNESR